MENSDPTKKEVPVSKEIYDQIESKIKNTEFSTVSEYVEYVLKQVLAKTSGKSNEEVYSEEEEEQVKERLKGLGYLE